MFIERIINIIFFLLKIKTSGVVDRSDVSLKYGEITTETPQTIFSDLKHNLRTMEYILDHCSFEDQRECEDFLKIIRLDLFDQLFFLRENFKTSAKLKDLIGKLYNNDELQLEKIRENAISSGIEKEYKSNSYEMLQNEILKALSELKTKVNESPKKDIYLAMIKLMEDFVKNGNNSLFLYTIFEHLENCSEILGYVYFDKNNGLFYNIYTITMRAVGYLLACLFDKQLKALIDNFDVHFIEHGGLLTFILNYNENIDKIINNKDIKEAPLYSTCVFIVDSFHQTIPFLESFLLNEYLSPDMFHRIYYQAQLISSVFDFLASSFQTENDGEILLKLEQFTKWFLLLSHKPDILVEELSSLNCLIIGQ
jgi:hypothetical protein